LRARFHRARVLDGILRPYGLAAHDGGAVPGIQLGTMAGASMIVQNLSEVWAEVERLNGTAIDPLDSRYLDDL
jgi:hypothetical protein